MDDRQLESMFRDAAGEPPAAGFDAADVASASRKATARRRSMITGVSAAAVVVLAGLGVGGVVLNGNGSSEDGSAVAAKSDPNAEQGQPGRSPARPPNAATPQQNFPATPQQNFPASPKQGGEVSGKNGPRAGTSGCEQVDRELATALAGELPVTVPAEPSPSRVCPTGSRSAGFPVRAGDRAGDLSIAVIPPGGSHSFNRPAGSATTERPTASGGLLVLQSVPAESGAEAPLSGELDGVAEALVGRY